MADTQSTTAKAGNRGDTEAIPQDRVEVFDTHSSTINENQGTIHRTDYVAPTLAVNDTTLNPVSFTTGNPQTGDLRTTDLNNSELGTSTPTGINREINPTGQGTNWGTILTVIVVILIIILVVSWIF